jgi:FlaA1/EpsC-like NDP-sugar epimerase
MARGGEIFALSIDEPMKIADLARNMIRLAWRTMRYPELPTS